MRPQGRDLVDLSVDRFIIDAMNDEQLQALLATINARFDAVDKRFESIDQRFEAIDERFKVIDRRFDSIDKRFDDQKEYIADQIADQTSELYAHFDRQLSELESRLTAGLATKVDLDHYSRTMETYLKQRDLDAQESLVMKQRITLLETRFA
jgi:hypothetical protein